MRAFTLFNNRIINVQIKQTNRLPDAAQSQIQQKRPKQTEPNTPSPPPTRYLQEPTFLQQPRHLLVFPLARLSLQTQLPKIGRIVQVRQALLDKGAN
jgi:hypothetical protein